MKTFALATNVFTIFFIFTINEVFSDLINIEGIYKLPKLNESYDTYQISVVRGSDGNDYNYQNILNEETFFKMIHNIDSRRKPKRHSNTYNYEVYSSEYEKYCREEHTSYELSNFAVQNTSSENIIPVHIMADVFTKLHKLKEDCANSVMTKLRYDDNQMLYHFLPQPSDTDINVYVDRINNFDLRKIAQDSCGSIYFLQNLNDAQKSYNSYYNIYITKPLYEMQTTDDNKKKYFIKLSGIRGIENERKYHDYVLRVLAKGFHPLYYDYWYNEYNNLENWKQYIEMETNYII